MDERGNKKFEFLLSLTGYLSFQEKKEKKGRLQSVKKGPQKYWFWFDEKDCALKYYKNQDSYRQYLHSPHGQIDMDDAKVTPAAAYEYTSNENLSMTFIILTRTGQYYALTADSAEICHDWIRKLQAKRKEYIKKESYHRKSLPRAISSRNYESASGLVGGDRSIGSSLGYELSRASGGGSVSVRKIFIDHLEGKVSPCQEYQDPFEDPKVRTDMSSSSTTHSTTDWVDTDGVREGEGRGGTTRTSTQSSDEGGGACGSGHGSFISSVVQLTEHERLVLELKLELSEARAEKDQVQKQLLHLQDEMTKKEEDNKKLHDEIDKLKETIYRINSPNTDYALENDNLRTVIESLQKSLKSLDGEVELHKLKLSERNSEIDLQKERLHNVQKELLSFKAKHVMLLSSSLKIQTPTPAGPGSSDDSDPYEEKLKEDLINLITEEETSTDSFLSTLKTRASFEDHYGDIHDWKGDSNIHHFLCRQLYLHYTASDQDSLSSLWYRYLEGLKKVPGTGQLHEVPNDRTRKREFRNYLRKGIPLEFRSQVWGSIINHHIGKSRDIRNSAATGGNYYQSLLVNLSPFNKQIQLDLYRTLPNNRHFKKGGTGADKLQRVLTAFCNHNKNVGYCQGMNMLAAIGLLFLDEETAFWYLVTIIEKLMPNRYYSDGLSAAQADQCVFKELISSKLSLLNEHLLANDIDVTIVSFNWFLTLFIDALPTESMLRIIDVFLYEGRKVLFRFSLAVLKLYERRILSMFDPVTIFQFIKEVVKHIFNVEELFRVAYHDFERFPSRSYINNKCSPFTSRFYDEYQERLKQKRMSHLHKPSPPAPVQPNASMLPTTSLKNKTRKQFQWECACVVNDNEVWLCCGERQVGKVCIVSAGEGGFDTTSPNLNVWSKILCIKVLSSDIVMIGTLDFAIHAVSARTKKELWSMKMNDSVLDFVDCDNTVLCALADGYIAVLQTSGATPPNLDPLLYRIGNTAVQAIVWTHFRHVWCGCGKAVTVISSLTHEPVKPVLMPDNAGKVYRMELGRHGIWITFKSSTIICLFDIEHMIKLLEIDYPNLLNIVPVSDINKGEYRIIVATPINDLLWIGTGNASIHIFSIDSVVSCPEDSIVKLARESKVIDSTTSEMSLQLRPLSDEGLVPTSISEEQSHPLYSRRKDFGKTFRRRMRQEKGVEEIENVYELTHLSSNRVLPKSQECSRVTILKPIKYEGQLFVISCVNTSSVVEKAVQLWQCSSTLSPNHVRLEHECIKYESMRWNYTCIPECYECVTKDWYPTMMSSLTNQVTPQPITERSRTYSTILGAPPINE